MIRPRSRPANAQLILSDTVSGSSVAPREQYPSSRSALLTCTDRANCAFRFRCRSSPVPDALDILSQLSARGVRFALGGSVYDWNDPFARMFLQILAVIAEFEANLIRQRTREGMAIARQNGELRGKQPTLRAAQDREIRRMHDSGDYSIAEIAGLFSVSRPTVYRSLERTTSLPPLPAAPGPHPTSPSTASCSPAALTERATAPDLSRSLGRPPRTLPLAVAIGVFKYGVPRLASRCPARCTSGGRRISASTSSTASA